MQVHCWRRVLRRNPGGSGGKGQGRGRNSAEMCVHEEVIFSLIPWGSLNYTWYRKGCSTQRQEGWAVIYPHWPVVSHEEEYKLLGISWWGTASLHQRQSGNQPKKDAELVLSSQHLVVHWPSEGFWAGQQEPYTWNHHNLCIILKSAIYDSLLVCYSVYLFI